MRQVLSLCYTMKKERNIKELNSGHTRLTACRGWPVLGLLSPASSLNIQSGIMAVPGLLPRLVTARPRLVTGLMGPEATVLGLEDIEEPEVTGLDPGCGSLELPEKSSS